MKKNNILLVVPSLAIGGQEKATIDTAKLLKEHNFVKIILFHKHEVEYDTNIDKIYLNVPSRKSKIMKIFGQIKRIIKLSKIRKLEKVDIVYSFGETANITNAISGIFSPGKSIISIHGFASVRKSFLNYFVYKSANKVICISQEMKNEISKQYPKLKNLETLENGYDLNDIVSKSNEHIGTKREKLNYIAMGRLEKVKGYDRLLHAFANVVKELPYVKLNIIGQGIEEGNLKKICENLGISNNVNFSGYKKNPYPYLKNADIFVLSSLFEGFPNALIEALACKAACISVDCKSGPREILCEGYTEQPIKGILYADYGILCEQCNNNEETINYLSKAMIMLGSNEEKLNHYKELGFKRASKFSSEIHKTKLLKIFEINCEEEIQ